MCGGGLDFTLGVPKSASVLWAVAFMEREVAATRTGATAGDGAVAQVDVTGLIATAFDHFDSRAGDPHLHTHVVISNKAQTVLDGKWRSLDGRPMHAAVVALSELHEAVFANHMTRTFGVSWEPREMGRDRNPSWAITDVPEELVAEFSTRARHINEATDALIAEYVTQHGKRPSPATIMKLRAQATLATLPEKQVRSLAELTAEWRTRASQQLGVDATVWARSLTCGERQLLLRADDVPLDLIGQVGRSAVSSSTSAAEVTRCARPVRSSSCGPRLVTLATGPGTAPTRRPSRWAEDTTRSAPPRPCAGLHDHRRGRHGSQQSGAGQEPMPRRHRSGRKLTDQRTHITHPIQQLTMTARVRAVHTTSEHRDRVTTGRQHRTVHSSLDTISATGHQHALTVRELGSQFARDMLPIRGGLTRPRDRHQVVQRPSQERRCAVHEQNTRGTLAQIIQRPGPLPITRNHSGDPAPSTMRSRCSSPSSLPGDVRRSRHT